MIFKQNLTACSAIRLFTVLVVLGMLSACSSTAYYWQAVQGQYEIISRERNIQTLLAQNQITAGLKRKLELIQRARHFAATALHLPVQDSYTSYADLQRPYVTWNVVATPALSVTPEQWCFLFAGCFNYRGYFHQQAAREYAQTLKHQGKDVVIAGSWAYSTLGWFNDPILNTMLEHDDAEVVGTLFHELGHRTVYVKNDSSFNESFANTVEQVGLQRWYQQLGQPEKYQAYRQREQAHREIVQMLEAARAQLKSAFARPVSDSKKLVLKQRIFAKLKDNYHHWRTLHHNNDYDHWMQQNLNNASLALVATYSDRIPEFLAMLKSVHDNLPAFYALAKQLGDMPAAKRRIALAAYEKSGPG